MGQVYTKHLIEGITVPAIIHNGSYFLIQMAVYENGTVSCWHRSDLAQFRGDLKRGWVVPSLPAGQALSIHGLGYFPVLDAHWRYDAEGFYQHIEDVVRDLNPEFENLYHVTEREAARWKSARVVWSASPTPCKLSGKFGHDLLDGNACFLFYRQNGRWQLTGVTAYADKTLQIEAAGDRFFTPEEIGALFADNILTTRPTAGEWTAIAGLGEVLLGEPSHSISAKNKRLELADTLATLSGGKDSLDHCLAAYHAYLTEPTGHAREALRKAYEAVPEHMRMYLGDMDTRDSDIIRILYHPEQKREV